MSGPWLKSNPDRTAVALPVTSAFNAEAPPDFESIAVKNSLIVYAVPSVWFQLLKAWGAKGGCA